METFLLLCLSIIGLSLGHVLDEDRHHLHHHLRELDRKHNVHRHRRSILASSADTEIATVQLNPGISWHFNEEINTEYVRTLNSWKIAPNMSEFLGNWYLINLENNPEDAKDPPGSNRRRFLVTISPVKSKVVCLFEFRPITEARESILDDRYTPGRYYASMKYDQIFTKQPMDTKHLSPSFEVVNYVKDKYILLLNYIMPDQELKLRGYGSFMVRVDVDVDDDIIDDAKDEILEAFKRRIGYQWIRRTPIVAPAVPAPSDLL